MLRKSDPALTVCRMGGGSGVRWESSGGAGAGRGEQCVNVTETLRRLGFIVSSYERPCVWSRLFPLNQQRVPVDGSLDAGGVKRGQRLG